MKKSVYFVLCIILLLHSRSHATKLHTFSADLASFDAEHSIFLGSGNVLASFDSYSIGVEDFIHDGNTGDIACKGLARLLSENGSYVQGYDLLFNNKTNEIFLRNAVALLENDIKIVSANANVKKSQITLKDAIYTPCSCKTSNPIWQVRANKVVIDYDNEVVTYNKAYFDLCGYTIGFLPYLKHPTPHAKPKSGLLFPAIKNKTLKIPVYLYLNKNYDVTITPRFFISGPIIYEGELRYVNQYGQCTINSSIYSPSMAFKALSDDNGNNARYYFTSQGSFRNGNMEYGFDTKYSSDPAYIRNYYQVYQPYLTSRGFVNLVDAELYITTDLIYFNDLMQSVKRSNNVALLPFVQIKYVSEYWEDFYLDLYSNNFVYSGRYYDQMLRTSNSVGISKIVDLWNINVEANASNRVDAYFSKNLCEYEDPMRFKRSFYRNTLDAKLAIRYPIRLGQYIIQPTIAAMYTPSRDRDSIIKHKVDSEYIYEVNDLNIFSVNKYSGIDCVEGGFRQAYGLDFIHFGSSVNKLFVGRFTPQPNDSANHKALISVSHQNDLCTSYCKIVLGNRSNLDSGEFGVFFDNQNLKTSLRGIMTKNVQDNNAKNNLTRAVNLYNELTYKINDKWSLEATHCIDCDNGLRLLSRTAGVTYSFDCIRIYVGMNGSYTEDASRSIKKYSEWSLSVGLKTLNM